MLRLRRCRFPRHRAWPVGGGHPPFRLEAATFPFRLGPARRICPDCAVVYEADDDDVCPHCGLAQDETTAWAELLTEIQAAGAHCGTQGCTEILAWDQTWCPVCDSAFAPAYWDEVEANLADGFVDVDLCWSPPAVPEGPSRRACCGQVAQECACPQPITAHTVADFFLSHDHTVAYADQSDPQEFCWSCTHWCSLDCPPLRAWAHGFFLEDRNDGPLHFFDRDRVGCPFYVRDDFVVDDDDDDNDVGAAERDGSP